MRKIFVTVNDFCDAGPGGTFVPAPASEAFWADIGFPMRSDTFIRDDRSMFNTEGNEFDSDDARVECSVLETLLGRPVDDNMIGKSFAITLGEVEEFDPEREVDRV